MNLLLKTNIIVNIVPQNLPCKVYMEMAVHLLRINLLLDIVCRQPYSYKLSDFGAGMFPPKFVGFLVGLKPFEIN